MTRKNAISRLIFFKNSLENKEDIAVINMAIKALKKEPKTGHWITKPHVYGVTYCSECDFELRIDNTNYCPNCGTKMAENGGT